MVVVGVVVIDRHPLKPGTEIALHPRDQVPHVLPQIDPAGIFGRHDDRPHKIAAPLPIADYLCDIEVIAASIKARAAANFALSAVPGQITRVSYPRTVAPVAPKGGLDHAAPSMRGPTRAPAGVARGPVPA